MSSPESGSPADAEPTFTPAFTLKEARENVGSERAGERTRLRDTEHILDINQTLETTTAAEDYYLSALITKTAAKAAEVRDRAPAGEKQEAVHKYLAKRIMDEQIKREQAEIEAKANPETRLGRLREKFVKAWKEHPKTRFVIGVGLVIASGGTAALGYGGAAAGVLAARAVMSGVGGYMGSKSGQEWAGRSFNRREGETFTNPGQAGNLAAIGETKKEAQAAAEGMTSEERIRRMAALLSPEAQLGRSDEQREADELTLKALQRAERQDVLGELQAKAETHRGRNFIHGAIEVLDARVSAQLLTERQRLQYDKRVNRRRVALSGIVGAALGITTVATAGLIGPEHEHARHAHKVARLAKGALDHHREASLPQINSTNPEALRVPGHYPDFLTNQIRPGETVHQVAHRLGGGIVEVTHLDPSQRELFDNFVAKHTTKTLTEGSYHWHTTKKVLQLGLELARRK
jgi:hypothetical protein